MLLWLILAAMTAGTMAIVLWPLTSSFASAHRRSEFDAAVYRDQLREVDLEVERGALGPADAEAARAEIGRRLLRAAERADGEAGPLPEAELRHNLAIPAVILAVSVISGSLYWQYGAPELPAQPHAARISAPVEDEKLTVLIARVEDRLREHPEDGEGWDVIAPVYMRLGRYQEAADAFASAGRLLGESTKRLEGFGEATVLAANGIVNERARQAFEKAVKSEPRLPKSRFWLAVAAEQDGRKVEAVAAYRALLAEAPDGAAWRDIVRERLATLDPASSSDAGKGPTAADVDAAAQMSDADRQAMIEGMVKGLAERLGSDSKDLDGWSKLVRAYSVLGKKSDATAALDRARRALADDAQAKTSLDDLARELGLGS